MRDADGRLAGIVLWTLPSVGMAVLGTLAGAGDPEHFARMQLVAKAFLWLHTTLYRLTNGRIGGRFIAGSPILPLTTTGRRTGKARSTPLLYAPDGDAFVVIGSNWGQAHHPAWSTILLADPTAAVTANGHTVAVRARLVDGAERLRMRELLLAVWPAYTTYEERSAGRDLRIFRLEPASAQTHCAADRYAGST